MGFWNWLNGESNNASEKVQEYWEITNYVDDYSERASRGEAPNDGPEYDAWHKQMEKGVDLYYELEDQGVDLSEKSGGNWFTRMFG